MAESVTTSLFCLIGPGASGKSSICQKITSERGDVILSISATTRSPRPNEVEGEDYYFVSKEDFLSDVSRREFLEYAEFAGNYYGTKRSNIERAQEAGADLLLDIDIQGVRQLKQLFPSNIVVVFVCPPSLSILKERFLGRGGDSENRILERMSMARHEIAEGLSEDISDYCILNEDFEDSIAQMRAILDVEALRLNKSRREALVNQLLKD